MTHYRPSDFEDHRFFSVAFLAQVAGLICLSVVVIAPDCATSAGATESPRDCLPHGPDLCGPAWDRDWDTISTATETNETNDVSNGGFYTLDPEEWDLNFSTASGSPNAGSLFDGFNLRDTGEGYTHATYRGCDPVDTDDWGTNHLLRLVEGAGRFWAVEMGHDFILPRIQSGDMSLRTGGVFATCGDAHDSHQNGLDVDMRYVRNDGGEEPLNICTQEAFYDSEATALLFVILAYDAGFGENGDPFVTTIFANMTCLGFTNDPDDPFIVHDASHDDHFHVRIEDPDGTND